MHPSAARLPPHIEARRVESLHAYGILDTPVEAVFEDITRIASAVCQTPIAVVTLVDAERQWFKSEVGLGVRETPLEASICAHAILEHDVLEVPDTTRDARFASNPLLTGDPRLRFYAGALLKTPDGLPLGTVCVLDTRPRSLTPGQIDTLRALSRQVMAQLELRRLLAEAHAVSEHRARVLASAGHDLKTPLRAALYAIRRTRMGASDAQRQTLDSAEQELTAIDQTFGELIASATGRGGFVPPALQAIDVVPVVEQVAAAWARAAARKPVAFELRIESACRARTHAGLLDTLLGNLVSNAVKYTPAGRRARRTGLPPGAWPGLHRRRRHRHRHGPGARGGLLQGVPARRCAFRGTRHRAVDRAPDRGGAGGRSGCRLGAGRGHANHAPSAVRLIVSRAPVRRCGRVQCANRPPPSALPAAIASSPTSPRVASISTGIGATALVRRIAATRPTPAASAYSGVRSRGRRRPSHAATGSAGSQAAAKRPSCTGP